MTRPERDDAEPGNQPGDRSDELRRCGACEAVAYDDDIYCACCGTPVRPVCRRCGGPVVHPVAFYCVRCGAALNDSTQ